MGSGRPIEEGTPILSGRGVPLSCPEEYPYPDQVLPYPDQGVPLFSLGVLLGAVQNTPPPQKRTWDQRLGYLTPVDGQTGVKTLQ